MLVEVLVDVLVKMLVELLVGVLVVVLIEVLEEVLVEVLVEVSAIQKASLGCVWGDSSTFRETLEILKLQHSRARND